MPESLTLLLPDAAATADLGRRVAAGASPPPPDGFTVWLQGELGAGKTTLVRALLQALGHAGRVPSPTYTLVEPYELPAGPAHHVDLYRLQDPAEAEYLGLAELPAAGGWLLVEWPERGAGFLPGPDLRVKLAVAGSGREAQLEAGSAAGAAALRCIAKA
ncbi:MAG: tRNA (adenosine(37)-N6)-threonylcarbamoyltransferase complex ATPase subunit type 1 TsaE [Chromatiales bacterium]|nr:MAG: tRNA (adenosine(37)-N6)-threonylcarbamoyltransferase complex ATPase subunit type 1 TsaE [Chromatiales bacterium]